VCSSDLKEGNEKENENESHLEEPTEFHPQIKKEGIFNDENLTEDYELGYRFFELGLKMGFFNVKLDNNNESSRISTAEFFPNTFWASVKQRSRWIAGICLQNWKAHKWKGNLTMKYFLFRDRKPLFSLLSAFLSNVILFYLVYAVVTNLVFGGDAVFLISHSSVLWYIMAANVIFMVSRASHRFIFTYNWYGFKYAFYSFFRLILDTAINFFAVLRSISVYKKIKKKVFWDSTSHY
jgi:adsorption protein B